MSEPWLSVVMPTYNGAAYLPETLASIEREGADGSGGAHHRAGAGRTDHRRW